MYETVAGLNCRYCKVASTSLSLLEADAGFLRLSMKGKFDVYLLWPGFLEKK